MFKFTIMSITLVGDIFCDIIAHDMANIPSWGEDSLCGKINLVAGGSLLNSAVHGCSYSAFTGAGIEINTFGAIGRDTQGEICMKAIRSVPYLVNNVIEKDDYTTGTCIVLSGKQDRLFITSRGCIEAMKLDWFGDKIFDNDSKHIHAAGFYNFSREVRQSWGQIFQQSKKKGLTTSLNPQYDATGEWTDIKELGPYLDFLITNELELLSITNVSSNEEGASIVCGWGCKCVVVTNSEGATAYTKNIYVSSEDNKLLHGLHTVDVHPEVCGVISHHQKASSASVQDTCGAGDAFVGAFLVEFLNSRCNLATSLRAGCIAGTAAVQLTGGSSAPSLELLSSTAATTPI